MTKKQYSACCTKVSCGKYFVVPTKFNESKHFVHCPVCDSPAYLNRRSLDENIKQLCLGKSEICLEEGVVKNQ
jgi:hypothetical protein